MKKVSWQLDLECCQRSDKAVRIFSEFRLSKMCAEERNSKNSKKVATLLNGNTVLGTHYNISGNKLTTKFPLSAVTMHIT